MSIRIPTDILKSPLAGEAVVVLGFLVVVLVLGARVTFDGVLEFWSGRAVVVVVVAIIIDSCLGLKSRHDEVEYRYRSEKAQ